MGHRRINIKKPKNLPLTKDVFKKIRRGEILHLAISYITSIDNIDNLSTYVHKALSFFQEKKEHWDIDNDFMTPLYKFFHTPLIEKIFPKDAKRIYIERNIISPNRLDIFRPDRCILFDDHVIVVDFKSEEPTSSEIEYKYKKQIEIYCKLVKNIFSMPCYGYIAYILKPSIKQVV